MKFWNEESKNQWCKNFLNRGNKMIAIGDDKDIQKQLLHRERKQSYKKIEKISC